MADSTKTQHKSFQWLGKLGQMLHFRLARRLFLVVFAAIVLIEFIIVIPSYQNYQTSLLGNYR